MAMAMERRWWAGIGLVLAFLVVAPVLIGGLAFRGRGVQGRAQYDAIAPGMTRAQIRQLMQEAGNVLYSDFSNVEIMHVNGRTMIAVVYGPPAAAAAPSDELGDDWIATEKRLVELGRGDSTDNTLVGLGLRSPRAVLRERIP